MRKRKPLIKPEVNPCFYKGKIIGWQFREKITPSHGKYSFRFKLTFSDGSVVPKERSGYNTRKKCLEAKELAITQLHNHNFVAFEVTVKEFYDYWLYYHMIDNIKIANGTYVSYRNIIYNYIIPKIGNMKINSVRRDTLIEVLDGFPTEPLLNLAYSVIGGGFKYAKLINMVNNNYAPMAIKTKRHIKIKEQHKSDAAASIKLQEKKPKKRQSLNSEQICSLLYLAKTKLPKYGYTDFYLPLLIACVTGCRISELICMKFHLVSYNRKLINLSKQLGRPIDDTGIEDGMLYKQEMPTKSKAGERPLPLPDFVIEEIVLGKERYNREKQQAPVFHDDDYIWHQPNGLPHGRQDYQKPFKLLKEWLQLPDTFHWHDLRHSFATIMVANNVNLKELSVVLGHSDHEGIFSLQTYVDGNQLIADGIPGFLELLDEVAPVTLASNNELVPKDEAKIIFCESLNTFLTENLPEALLKKIAS